MQVSHDARSCFAKKHALAYQNAAIQNLVSCSCAGHPEYFWAKHLLLHNPDVLFVDRIFWPEHAQKSLKVFAQILLCHLAYEMTSLPSQNDVNDYNSKALVHVMNVCSLRMLMEAR